MTGSEQWGRWHWLALIVLVYAVAFLLPAACLHAEAAAVRAGGEATDAAPRQSDPLTLTGQDCFAWGARLAVAPWFANPLLWVGCWLLATHRWVAASLAGLAALALGLTEAVPNVLDLDRAGHRTELLPGYWAWLASMQVLFVAGLSGRLLAKKPQRAAEATARVRLPSLAAA